MVLFPVDIRPLSLSDFEGFVKYSVDEGRVVAGRFQVRRQRSTLVGTTRCVASAYTAVSGGIDTADIY